MPWTINMAARGGSAGVHRRRSCSRPSAVVAVSVVDAITAPKLAGGAPPAKVV